MTESIIIFLNEVRESIFNNASDEDSKDFIKNCDIQKLADNMQYEMEFTKLEIELIENPDHRNDLQESVARDMREKMCIIYRKEINKFDEIMRAKFYIFVKDIYRTCDY